MWVLGLYLFPFIEYDNFGTDLIHFYPFFSHFFDGQFETGAEQCDVVILGLMSMLYPSVVHRVNTLYPADKN